MTVCKSWIAKKTIEMVSAMEFWIYYWTTWLSELPRLISASGILWQVGLSLRRASRELDVGVPQYLRRRWREYPNYPFHANRTSTQGLGNARLLGNARKILNPDSMANIGHWGWPWPLQPMPADARWLLSIPLNPAWRSDILFEMFDPKKKGEVSYSAPGGLWQGFRHPNIWLCLK